MGTVFNLSTPVLSALAFRQLTKSDFVANLDVWTPAVFFKSVFVA